jgi:hypothetical protein
VPAQGGFQYGISTKDDYSRLFVGAQLIEKEGSFAHLEKDRRTNEHFGRPQAYYVDQNKVFRFVEHHGVHVRDTLGLDEGDVQFKRALRSLGIGLIYTEEGPPESKGKIEKPFDCLQRRVPYLCERYRIRTIQDAQPILQEEVQLYNEKHIHEQTGEIPIERWKAAIQAGKSYLRPLLETDLDLVFSLHCEGRVKNDGRFSFRGTILNKKLDITSYYYISLKNKEVDMKKTIIFCSVMLLFLTSTLLAQTKSMIIPATEFKPMNTIGEAYTGERFAYPTSTAYTHWGAPIYLPDGAQVVKVTLFYYDDTGGQIILRIQRTNLYDNSYIRPFEVTSELAGSPSIPAVKSASGYMKVNNTGYEHIAWIYFSSATNVRIWGVKIIYNE